MSNRRAVLVAGMATMLMSVFPMLAQPPGGGRGGRMGDPKEMMERQVTMMKERLNLTADQEKKVRTILADNGAKMMEAREKAMEAGGPPTPEMRESMMKLREEGNDAIAKVLDEKQKAEFTKMREEMAARGPGGPGGRRGPRQEQ